MQEDGPGPPARLLVLHAGAGLHGRIPARTIGEAMPGRVGGDRAVHQAGKPLGQRVVGQLEPLHGARAERLHQNVGAFAQPEEHLASLLRLEIQHHRSPAAVPHVIAGLAAKRVTTGRLDLDDVGTELREQQHADRPGDAPAQIEDTHTLQWAGGLGHVRGHSLTLSRSMNVLLRRGVEPAALR